MVQLTVAPIFCQFHTIWYFNSSMVQLTGKIFSIPFLVKFISIPVWYNWRHELATIYEFTRIISIPVWYNWRKSLWESSTKLEQISIPVWYNWRVQNDLAKTMFGQFQFQYGTIDGDSFFKTMKGFKNFNSSMVQLTDKWRNDRYLFKQISIHYKDIQKEKIQ